MKHPTLIVTLLLVAAALTGCKKYLDRELETNYEEEEVFVNYDRISQAGYGVYTFLFNRFGFDRISNAMLASACDEADHADPASEIQKYNMGAWNATSNPENYWADWYQGIYRANIF